jgi:hypothetical protein
MAEVVPLFRDAAFEPNDLLNIAKAFDEVCERLGLPADASSAREVVATKIIALARAGERNPTTLRDRLLSEFDIRQVIGQAEPARRYSGC